MYTRSLKYIDKELKVSRYDFNTQYRRDILPILLVSCLSSPKCWIATQESRVHPQLGKSSIIAQGNISVSNIIIVREVNKYC